MDLRPHATTMSLSGRSDASLLRGLDARMQREVLYFGLLPNLLLSLHPDYVVAYHLAPVDRDRTLVDCPRLLSPDAAARARRDPGCGKTTTLRLIAGFEQPTQGSVVLDGLDVAETPPHRRNVNTVFQSYALFPFLSVEDNVAFGLRYKGVSAGQGKDRVRDALAL